jgi:Cu(I)/Ag(I) efflux system membrane fusion protein
MMNSPDDRQPGPWDDVVNVPRLDLRRLAPVVAAYLSLQRALADDDLARSQVAATKIEEELPQATLESSPEATRSWEMFSKSLSEHAKHVVQANSLEQARKGFEGLSGTIVMVLRVLGNPLDRPVVQAHCPMARGSEGASWVQEGEELDNSYFGASMLSCGDVINEVKPGEHLATPGEGKTESTSHKPVGGHKH